MNPVFNDLDHRLSVVNRWGIAHTIQTQSVAEHCFNVERIAARLAKTYFDCADETIGYIMMLAHHHDDHEALSGDLPTMVKPYFNEIEFEKDHADLVPLMPHPDWMRNIVKLADMLEGYHFLCIEKALGNTYLELHLKHEPQRILDWIDKTYANREDRHYKLRDGVTHIMHDMANPRSVRHSKRGR